MQFHLPVGSLRRPLNDPLCRLYTVFDISDALNVSRLISISYSHAGKHYGIQFIKYFIVFARRKEDNEADRPSLNLTWPIGHLGRPVPIQRLGHLKSKTNQAGRAFLF
jgi:hypothetical protein